MLEIITTKLCTSCCIEKDLSLFYKEKLGKFGVRSKCKECFNSYYNENKHITSIKMQAWRIANRDKMRKYQKKYFEKNKALLIDKSLLYSKTPIGRAIQKNANHNRRSIIRNGDVTTQQLLELEQNAKLCYWCNKSLKNLKIHIDHYTPLAKGGKHTISNLVISCSECNHSKSAKDPIQFANRLGRLL